MAQSLSNLLVHLIFSTKERRPFLGDVNHRAAMHRYLGAVAARRDCPVIRVGGSADHGHCLARPARTITVAEWVKELKRASSQWAKTQSPTLRPFQWPAGYGAFSVSHSLSQKVEQYIEGQGGASPHVRLSGGVPQAARCPRREHMTSGTCGIEAAGRNPFRVEELFRRLPQGSRQKTRQPWAMLRNAFGVESHRTTETLVGAPQLG